MEPEVKTATGREIILEIVRAMRANVEPLLYSTIAPARFFVYLHPDDYRRLEGILPLVVDEARRALDADVSAWNDEARRRRLSLPWKPREPAPAALETPAEGWAIQFEMDADEEMQPGDIAVASELSLPPREELAGARTRRVTVKSGEASARPAELIAVPPPTPGGGTLYATLAYEDNTGPHTFEMTRSQVVIGRGGLGYWVDLKLATSADVSREHVRLRRDEETGQFFLKDMSSLGTTIDGRPVPPSLEVVDGAKRDSGVEVPLPPRARIGLADTVFLDFEVGRSP